MHVHVSITFKRAIIPGCRTLHFEGKHFIIALVDNQYKINISLNNVYLSLKYLK